MCSKTLKWQNTNLYLPGGLANLWLPICSPISKLLTIWYIRIKSIYNRSSLISLVHIKSAAKLLKWQNINFYLPGGLANLWLPICSPIFKLFKIWYIRIKSIYNRSSLISLVHIKSAAKLLKWHNINFYLPGGLANLWLPICSPISKLFTIWYVRINTGVLEGPLPQSQTPRWRL